MFGLLKKSVPQIKQYKLDPAPDLTPEEGLMLSLFFQSSHWTWGYGLIVDERELERLDEKLYRHFVQL